MESNKKQNPEGKKENKKYPTKLKAINKLTGEQVQITKAPTFKKYLNEDTTIIDNPDGSPIKIILNEKEKEAIDILFSSVAEGNSLFKSMDKQKVFSLKRLYNLINIDADYRKYYAQVCEEREKVMFESTLTISFDTSNDMYMNEKGVLVPNPVAVQRARLQCDVIDKMLARMNHKKYGNRTVHSGDSDNPVVIQAVTGMVIE